MEFIIFLGIIYLIYLSIKKGASIPAPPQASDSTITTVAEKKDGRETYRPIKKIPDEKKTDISNIKLTEEQEILFNELENSHDHFLVTGKAGTGKSILLQYLKCKSKKTLVVGAYTGVAALNVGAQTLNSLFKLPTGFIDTNELHLDETTAMLLRHIDAVVIDEISMVRADMMDAIDALLRQARKSKVPFGGVQIIMFGDPYQLAPITEDELGHYFAHNHGGPYFFNAHVWRNTSFHIYELTHVLRQEKDQEFKKILNSIRVEELEDTTLPSLNQRLVSPASTEGIVTLASTNRTVNNINRDKLARLRTPQFVYVAEIKGHLERSAFPTDEILKLKKGAQVMLLKNDPSKRWVNGSIGIIESLSQFEIKVNIRGITYSIPKASWKKIRYYYNRETRKVEEEIMSEFHQYPLRLAWAITIHKSQGKTYDSMIVDMEGGAFAHGQTYVALSRCTSLSGLYLKYPIRREDVIVDPVVHSYMRTAEIKTPKKPVKTV